MTHAHEPIEITISAQRRRELVSKLCFAINDAFSWKDQWQTGCELRHWQVTATDFESLPASIIETVVDEWFESDERLDEIELSGYLDTGDGHRAWGFLALRPNEPRGQGRPALEHLEVNNTGDGLALRAVLRRTMPPEETPAIHE